MYTSEGVWGRHADEKNGMYERKIEQILNERVTWGGTRQPEPLCLMN